MSDDHDDDAERFEIKPTTLDLLRAIGARHPSLLLSVGHAAEALDCDRRQIRDFVRDGQLRIVRLSARKQRIRVDDLLALVERLTEGGDS